MTPALDKFDSTRRLTLKIEALEVEVTQLRQDRDKVLDALDKWCRGSVFRRNTSANMGEIVDKVCALALQDTLAKQKAEAARDHLRARLRAISERLTRDVEIVDKWSSEHSADTLRGDLKCCSRAFADLAADLLAVLTEPEG